MFRAHQASACPAALIPLTEDWAALHARIDAMHCFSIAREFQFTMTTDTFMAVVCCYARTKVRCHNSKESSR